MSFSKFRLDNPPERSAPIPIAAAVSRTSSGRQDERALSTPSATHSGNNVGAAGNHDLRVPRTDPKARCRKSTTPKFRRKAACIGCQTSKTRCENPLSGSKDKCRRCLRLNKECIVYPSIRLPSEEDSAKQGGRESGSSHETSSCCPENYGKERPVDVKLKAEVSASFSQGFIEANPSSRPLLDVQRKQLDLKIDSVISGTTAEQVFHQYISSFVPKSPIVVFPPGTTAESVRKDKPLLFLSILSIASAGYCTLANQRELAVEVRGQLADRAIVQGEKSLELVQALQVTSLWYRAPDDYRQMNQNQLAHITTIMAIDLGLDNIEVLKPTGNGQGNWDRLEAQRAWLGCFLLSSSLSLILRRHNPIPWTAKLDDYLADLERIKAASTDEFLCRLVATERLCHDIDQELFLSDPVRSVSARDPKTLMIIQEFQSRNDWPPLAQLHSLQKSIVQFGRFASSLYAHEMALHVNHNIEEFKAPFFAKSLKTCNFIDTKNPDPSHLSMLRTIVTASQGLLDTFLGLSVSDMFALPPHIYGGRVVYAVVILMKIHKAITASGKRVNNFIHSEELCLETYLEQLVALSKLLIAKDERNALSRAFLVMPQLMGWFYLHRSRKPLGANRNKAMEDSPIDNSNGQERSASLTPTGTLSGSPTSMQTPGHDAVPDNVAPPDGPGCQFDELIQPAVLPSFPAYGRESSFELHGLTAASDSWFSEFFNVEMLS